MTIAQRIELRRLGYTKEEVAQMIEEEKAQPAPEPAPAPDPEPAPALEPAPAPAAAPDINAQILAAINNLSVTLQQQNIRGKEQPDSKPPETSADVFNAMLN